MIFNFFCDASIDINTKVACGGTYITCQDDMGQIKEIGHRLIIQKNATNNSAEILAIWAGVVEAIKLREIYPNAVFRLFSDSKISLYGLRDWIKNWIRQITPEGVLISSSGQPVANQQRFIDIFNMIVENSMKIEFYHQRGHVVDGRVSRDKARVQFIRANKVPPEGLGLTIEYLSKCNDRIDSLSRNAIYVWQRQHKLAPCTEIEGITPFVYQIRDTMLAQYIRCIDKTSITSHHDFKGGWSQ